MFINNIPHWKPVEESKDSTTFEGSLQSKISLFTLVKNKMSFLEKERRNTQKCQING
jgi:hypothetical protein